MLGNLIIAAAFVTSWCWLLAGAGAVESITHRIRARRRGVRE